MFFNPLRRWWFAGLLGLLAIGERPTSAQKPLNWIPPTTLDDPRLARLRLASSQWATRRGPDRLVVDQVCLVPDLPTFFEAISTWDESHYFPILFDDVETSFRFIRAFKPARIIRYPRTSAPIPSWRLWQRATEAAGESRLARLNAKRTLPPGVVVSSKDAPMLAGAVALAAGRFQPLISLDFGRRFGDVLSIEELAEFDLALTRKVRDRVPNFEGLGDDCDFLTIAGDWPYRYRDPSKQHGALDDVLGRLIGSGVRWGFVGRLLGDPAESVYRAMCSLFLQPGSAMMFNGYDEVSVPWSDYAMREASLRLDAVLPTSHVSGAKSANLEGWHETFDPTNRFGLVLINSHGSPTEFHLQGGPASTSDVPRTIPSAVLMIHSYSAASPNDPSTIAGRWLSNGAFVYFGSMDEPFLQSFRTPRLVADLLARGLPMVTAVRASQPEPYGTPWRLVYLGDPLFHLEIKGNTEKPRVARWEPTESWPVDAEGSRPTNGSDLDTFVWVWKAALGRLPEKPLPDDLVDSLLAIRRPNLPQTIRPQYDALLVEVMLQARKRTALRNRIAAEPMNERSPSLQRSYENLLVTDLNRNLARKDAEKARQDWSELLKTGASREFKERTTTRVGQLADTPDRRREWSRLLRETIANHGKSPESEALAAESRRVLEAMKADP